MKKLPEQVFFFPITQLVVITQPSPIKHSDSPSMATLVAKNTALEVFLRQGTISISFSNEQLIIYDDLSGFQDTTPHFVKISSHELNQGKLDQISHQQSTFPALRIDCEIFFSPSASPEIMTDDVHLSLQTKMGLVEVMAISRTFPPFLDCLYRLLTPLDTESLILLGIFQEISLKTYQHLQRKLFISLTSIFEGVSIFFCEPLQPFLSVRFGSPTNLSS